MSKTTITNDTGLEIHLKQAPGGIYSRLKNIPPGGEYAITIDPDSTYWEYMFELLRVDSSSLKSNRLFVSSDDFIDWKAIRMYLKDSDEVFTWEGTVRRIPWLDDRAFRSANKDVSMKLDAALRSCDSLDKLLERVKICRNQCKHLVTIYKEGIQKMAQIYPESALHDERIERLYINKTLPKLANSLDRLEYIVCDAKDLLRACTKELGKIALVVSMPMPPVEKEMEACSDFVLLVRELKWNLDLIEYLLQPGDVEWEWSPTMHRYVLRRIDGSRTIVAGEKAADQTEDVLRRLACKDREELQSGLEDGSIFIPNTIRGWCERRCFGLGRKNLNATVLERCKVKMAQDLQSLPVDPECLRIDHLDLKLNTARKLGKGASKKTYEGQWYKQTVAISTIRMDKCESLNFENQSEIFKDEVKQLLLLQHPKVVSLFGWAETNDAPVPIKKPNDDGDECIHGGYIVTEKMECELHKLIMMQNRATKRDLGGPFSHSVELDILLQIVEAMLHVQKHGVMHRDLKPGNFLVNSRSLPRPGKDIYYNVKLIDFGSSKLYTGEDRNTYNKGTTTYGAPEMMKGTEREADHGKYGPSVDVFSFAMTCYQVITGKKPFEGTDASTAINSGKRPEFLQTVLFGLKELTEHCWAEDPGKRPPFAEIQERLWTIKKKLAVS